MSQSKEIAIIGAGLSGLALALSLHSQGIRSEIFESRPAPLNIGGAVMLSPNSLRIFDTLGLYQSIKTQGYNFETLQFRTVSGEVIETYPFGSEARHGYRANRLYRHELIDIMLDAVKAAGVEVVFGKKFSHVVQESDDHVAFEFTDGTAVTSTMLIGADGIHSTVRKHLYPTSEYAPRFIGMAGVTASTPASNLPANVTVDRPITIVSKKDGAFVLAPQKVDGSELLIGKQKRIPGNPTREEWDAIHADKQAAIDFLRDNTEVFGNIAVGATRDIPEHNINIWPFFVVPKLDKWASETKRIVLLGDAAHAIPPSAGQGISQAMEDVFMLALLMGKIAQGHAQLENALEFWQNFRQNRILEVMKVNARVDKRRLPRGDDEPEVEKEDWDLDWLYAIDLQKTVDDWIAQQ